MVLGKLMNKRWVWRRDVLEHIKYHANQTKARSTEIGVKGKDNDLDLLCSMTFCAMLPLFLPYYLFLFNFWSCRVFVAVCGISLVAASGGYL